MRALRYALLALMVTVVASAQPAPPPTPTRFVTDGAGFLSPATRDALDARLAAYERASGHQVLVWVGPTTGGEPLEPWCARAFESWRVGRRGIDDGLALFFFARDRRVRIEVGYGLESVATDAQTARILREGVIPRLRANDNDGAVAQGVDGVLALLGETAKPQALRAPQVTLAMRVAMGLLALLFVALMIRHPRLAWLLLMSLRHGSRGGGGRGFSGGGGRSGGGGSSGSW